MKILNWFKMCRDVYFYVERNKELLNKLADEFEEKRAAYKAELVEIMRKIEAANEFYEAKQSALDGIAQQNESFEKRNKRVKK